MLVQTFGGIHLLVATVDTTSIAKFHQHINGKTELGDVYYPSISFLSYLW